MKNKCTQAQIATPRRSADNAIQLEVNCIVLFVYALFFSAAILTIEINYIYIYIYIYIYTGLFISHSGISELDCATTKTDTAERSI